MESSGEELKNLAGARRYCDMRAHAWGALQHDRNKDSIASEFTSS